MASPRDPAADAQQRAAAELSAIHRAGQRKLVFGFIGLGLIVLVALGLTMVFDHSRAPTAEEKRAQEDAEMMKANEELSELNARLKQEPCDAKAAERRVAIFQQFKRGTGARNLARQFIARCGDNAMLRAVTADPAQR